jgi:RNA-binding protein FUS
MKPKIWLYKDKETGSGKGEATVTYDDTNAAQSAISWFNGQGKGAVFRMVVKAIVDFCVFVEFNGARIQVSLAQRQNTWQNKRGGGRFGGGKIL